RRLLPWLSGSAPAQPLLRQRRQILGPALVALSVERLKIRPAVEPGVMAIVEDDAHGVIADRFQVLDLDVAFLSDRYALLGGVALHLGRRAPHAQHLCRQLEGLG